MRSLLLLTALCTACVTTPTPPPTSTPKAPIEAASWDETLERVLPCIVSLKVTIPRALDTSSVGNIQGTGFIVDRERGIILTNRHLTLPNPVRAEAVLYNHEEVSLEELYYDPVHDFGFYRFDPSKIAFTELCELPLDADAARVGTEIRVVGNDAGEKISILPGTLARLDRDAPNYGPRGYNDFNTFYYQAASSTSGGSSGSPVLDIQGRVVALNAGGSRRAASSFYLPLNPVIRALKNIQASMPVPRGTLQTTWVHTPYDELVRLGLRPKTQEEVRAFDPETKGMLRVLKVVPGGPGSKGLEPGDILVRINGALVTRFWPLESALDAAVGKEVEVEIERAGASRKLKLKVDDLHALSPRAYVEAGYSVFHPLSYQKARNRHIAASGMYVARAGYMLQDAGIPGGAVIDRIDGVSIDSVDTLWKVFEGKPDRHEMRVEYRRLSDPRQQRTAMMRLDRRWFPMRRCEREESVGRWSCQNAAPGQPAAPAKAFTDTLPPGPSLPDAAARAVASSLIKVRFRVPYQHDGIRGSSYLGTGLIVDEKRGLVVVDRDTVPVTMGDLELIFEESVKIPGKIEAIHPLHNLTLISYDPKLVPTLKLRAAKLETKPLKEGDKIWQVTLSRGKVRSRETKISRVTTLSLSGSKFRPSFVDRNIDIYELDESRNGLGGVLVGKKGKVRALWSSFPSSRSRRWGGMPAHVVSPIVEQFKADGVLKTRTMGVEFSTLGILRARDMKLPQARLTALAKHDPESRHILRVKRRAPGFDATDKLRNGDLLLSVDGKPVTRFGEVEVATQKPKVTLELWRKGKLETLEVETTELGDQSVDRLVRWAGMTLQRAPLALPLQLGVERSGVYVAFIRSGTPGGRYRLRPTRRIMAVNETPTPDLDAFLKAVKDIKHGDVARLKVMTLKDQPSIVTLKLDLVFSPTEELVRTDKGWVRRDL